MTANAIHRGSRRWGALATVCLAVTVIVMDGSIVNVALPTLTNALGGASNSQLQWIVDAYILSFAALLLSAGSAADRHGRRRLLLLGLGTFAAMSTAASFSRSPLQLITWRALMGIGAAMIFPSTLAILTAAFPEPRLRRLAIGAWAGCSGLGVAIGPVVGGWLLTHHDWGSVFLINVPLAAVAFIGCLAFVAESREAKRCPLDLAGNLLAVAGLVSLVWGLIEGPEKGWRSPGVVAALGGSAVLLVAFARWESRQRHPMLDVRMFRSRRFVGGCLAITTAFFGLFGFVFMVTQFFQFICGYDALSAGLRTLPFAGFILLGSALAARSLPQFQPRMLCGAGLLLMAAGFAWAVQDRPSTAYATLVCQMGLLGTGLGLVSASATDVIMGSLAADHFGLGSSVNDTAREVGGTLGVAIMGSVFNAVYRQDIASSFAAAPLPAEAREALQQSVGVAIGVIQRVDGLLGAAAADAVRGPVQGAFMHGFHASSMLAAAAAAAGSVVVVACMPDVRKGACGAAGDERRPFAGLEAGLATVATEAPE
jgi:EmrB/QacA subfamily drug resistance transporter